MNLSNIAARRVSAANEPAERRASDAVRGVRGATPLGEEDDVDVRAGVRVAALARGARRRGGRRVARRRAVAASGGVISAPRARRSSS